MTTRMHQTIGERGQGARASQGHAKHNSTYQNHCTKSKDEVTLADRDKTIYVKSLQSLRLYQQIDNEVIDEYRSRIFKHSPGVNRRIISSPLTQTIIDDFFD